MSNFLLLLSFSLKFGLMFFLLTFSFWQHTFSNPRVEMVHTPMLLYLKKKCSPFTYNTWCIARLKKVSHPKREREERELIKIK